MDISVYKISNVKTGKFYIGYSKETEKRFRTHRNMFKRGDHHCIHLQRSWDTNGEDCFIFERIKTFFTVEEAVKEEQAQLDLHFSLGVMYNSVSSNDSSVVIQLAHTKEAINKGADSKRKSIRFMEALAKNRLNSCTPESQEKRLATTKRNGNFGKTAVSIIAREEYGKSVLIFKSIQEAARTLKLSAGNIHGCCNGSRPRVGGYLFSYELPWLNQKKIDKLQAT